MTPELQDLVINRLVETGALAHVRAVGSVMLADLALLSIVLLFRAMKLHDLSAYTRRSWSLVAVLFALSIGFALMAR